MLVSKVMLRPETYTIFYTCRRESTHAGERVHMQEKERERERVNTAGHEHYSGEYTKWRFSFDVIDTNMADVVDSFLAKK